MHIILKQKHRKMKIQFTKMQGAGNDYVYINAFQYPIEHPEEAAIRLSNRHFGVGSDGLVLIMPSDSCDFRMRMFNADGSEAQMCGNASRCIGKYVYEKGLTNKTSFTLETLSGVKHLSLTVQDKTVKEIEVDMGRPVLTPTEIPVLLPEVDEVIDYPINISGFPLHLNCVSMGNPHAVFFVNDLSEIDIHGLGRILEHHPVFPERTNVEFAQVLSREEIKMRVWERGSGETMACGTGACATVVAAIKNGLCDKKVLVHLPGGDLYIKWENETDSVMLSGPAEIVFEGEMEL